MKNLNTLIPTVSVLVIELTKIQPMGWQDKNQKSKNQKELKFLLMIMAERKNTLVKTVNFLSWIYKEKQKKQEKPNQINNKTQPLLLNSFEPSGIMFTTSIPSGETWPQLKSSCPQQWQ